MSRALVLALSLILWVVMALAPARAQQADEDLFPPGLPEPGFLGLTVRWVDGGVEILTVDTDGPADQIGLRPYDLIVGQADPVTPTLVEPFHSMPAGSKSILHVRRSGGVMTYRCTWDTLSPRNRERLQRRLAYTERLTGQVDAVSGRRLGIRLLAPAAGLPRLSQATITVLRGEEYLGRIQFLRRHDDWRIVAESHEWSPQMRPGDVVDFQMKPVQRADTWGPNWNPEPDLPSEPERRPFRRKIRVHRGLLDAHVAVLQGQYASMLAALPAEVQAMGQQVELHLSPDPAVNAYAGFDRHGRRVIVVNRGICELVLLLSYVEATLSERTLSSALEEIDKLALVEGLGADQFTLPAGFASRTRDAAFVKKMNACATPMYTFILGHELGHHLLSHPEQLNGDDFVGRMLEREEEKEADNLAARIVHLTGADKLSVLFFTSFMTAAETYQGMQRVPDYLQTHPDWSARTAYLEGVFSTF